MRRTSAFLLLLLMGCGRQADLEGPAPDGALECSLAYGQGAGYQRVEGSSDEGFIRMIQRVTTDPANQVPRTPEPDLSDAALDAPDEIVRENEILVREDRGRLHFTILGTAEAETGLLEGSTAMDQARTMLAMCSASPPVFPAGPDTPPQPVPPAAPL